MNQQFSADEVFIEKRGGLEKIESLAELKHAVIEGAVHRLRPKLLTEGVAIVGESFDAVRKARRELRASWQAGSRAATAAGVAGWKRRRASAARRWC